MEKLFDDLNVIYNKGKKSNWTGRHSNPSLPEQYWHQIINPLDINKLSDYKPMDFALLGYVCDEGVRRNLGRVGAKEAPFHVRENLAKLPIHFNDKTIADCGDIVCKSNDMEACQNALAQAIELLISNRTMPIVIGGGHDVAYGHFLGIKEALKHRAKKKIGIINFDAHFDLRPVLNKPNSGTPFNQILSESDGVDYFVIGIQQQSNTKALFDIAKEKNVDFVFNYDCENTFEHLNALQDKLNNIVKNNDYIYLSIDMDGFSSAYAPGVSASSALGFSPHFAFKILKFLLDTKKVIASDIVELNPEFDVDNRTSNLVAKIVDFIVLTSRLKN